MNDTVMTFLSEGRKFRHKRSRGPFLVIENDATLGLLLERWIDGMDQHAVLSSYISGATPDLCTKPKCVIIGLDGQDKAESKLFLATIDQKYPEIVAVAYTSSNALAFSLKNTFPRLTVLCKGEGLADLLSELDSEVHVKEFVA